MTKKIKKQKDKKPLKPLFRQEIRDNSEKFFGKPFDDLNHTEMSRCMTRTYVEAINKMKYPEIMPLDSEDYERCDTDGSGDLNIDFICRENNTVVIIQSKYHHKGSKDKPEDRKDFVDFCEVLIRLHDGSYQGNEKVNDIACEIDWDNDNFFLYFNTLSKASDNIRTREKKQHYALKNLPSGFEERVEITFNDEEDLNLEYRSYLDWTLGVKTPVRITPIKHDENDKPWLICKSSNGRREAYVGTINGKQLRELWKPKEIRNRLFAENIRNPMGVSTRINKDIRKTAIDNSEEFFFFNNGISAIAESIEVEELSGDLICKKLSVINGAQTVMSLVKPTKKNEEMDKLGEAQVLIRVTKTSSAQKEKEMKFTRDVIRFNNTQNKIVASDFCSNESIQLDLERRFDKVKKVNGKSFCYLRKRTDVRGKRDLIKITKESFAKNIHSFLYGPPDMFGGINKLFDSTSVDGRYVYVFGDTKTIYESFDEEDFLKFAGIYFFSSESLLELKKQKEIRVKDEADRIETARKNNEPEIKPIIENALYSPTLFLYTLGNLLRARYRILKLELDADLVKIGNPKWIEKNSNVYENLKIYVGYAVTILINTYRNASSKPGFAHRNWFRKGTTKEEVMAHTNDNAFDYKDCKGILD
jgi:hypothetical protein